MGSTAITIFMLFSAFALVAYGQPDFISIDCGKPRDGDYKDSTTGITYVSDDLFVETGKNHAVAPEFEDLALNFQSKDLRSFPDGKRNCYSLKPVIQGNRYLVRAFFMYGNYDGLNRLPRFDLHLGTNLWASVSLSNASSTKFYEILAIATGNSMSVCMIDTGLGMPFISALELRPFNDAEEYMINSTQSLLPVMLVNFGAPANLYIRYPDDTGDRIWTPFTDPSWSRISTTATIDSENDYKVPMKVMQTAVTPITGSSVKFSGPVDDMKDPSQLFAFKHFADFKSVYGSRILSMSLNEIEMFSNFTPRYLRIFTYYNSNPYTYSKLDFSVTMDTGSSLPPIINAIEVLKVNYLRENATDSVDVEAITVIKTLFQIQRNWMGDPCSPLDFIWNGLRCNYVIRPYRIISLNLSSSRLTGQIPLSLANLTQLQYLDLSTNSFSGSIPEFLGDLSNLKFLNLTCSGLDGSIPKTLQVRSDTKLLTLVRNPCPESIEVPGPGHTSRKLIIIFASVGSVLILMMVVGIIFWRKKKHEKKKPITPLSPHPEEPGSQYRRFTHADLVKMTNNFQRRIGKGGFGLVFYGQLENYIPVAIKKLSELTAHGITQFQSEIEVLERIHHRYLITLIGYCDEKNNLALVYEYMPKGSLADHLSDGKEVLIWRERLRIASETAQGLNYLHTGCKRTIIHRDVKTTNILLTEDLEARITDFGISRILSSHELQLVTTKILGTPGYLDPEYWKTSCITDKSDVYSFGIVLLELITGHPAIFLQSKESSGIVGWVESRLPTGDLSKIVDIKFQGDYNNASVSMAIDIAMACTASCAVDRPPMSEVVTMLTDCLRREEVGERSGHSLQVRYHASGVFTGIRSTGNTSSDVVPINVFAAAPPAR